MGVRLCYHFPNDRKQYEPNKQTRLVSSRCRRLGLEGCNIFRRRSPIKPFNRAYPCTRHAMDWQFPQLSIRGERLSFPKGKVIRSNLCDCNKSCCVGIHYFKDKFDATGMTCGSLHKVVRCYVPKGGKFVVRADICGCAKCRCDQLVTL